MKPSFILTWNGFYSMKKEAKLFQDWKTTLMGYNKNEIFAITHITKRGDTYGIHADKHAKQATDQFLYFCAVAFDRYDNSWYKN